MSFSDPVANMLTSIRNSNMRGNRNVIVPFSNLKREICKKMKQTGFISNYWVDEKNRSIKIIIRYWNGSSKINKLKKVSKISRHIYVRKDEIKKYCKDYGVYIISTSSEGLQTHKEALEKGIGGKIIMFIS